MKDNFPLPIVSEKDLSVYEDFLLQDTKHLTQNNKSFTPETLTNPIFLPAYLKNHIGKLVKIEAQIGENLETKIGTLMQIGADFVVIKLKQNCSSMVIEGKCIKFITIIHDKKVFQD